MLSSGVYCPLLPGEYCHLPKLDGGRQIDKAFRKSVYNGLKT